HVLMDAISSATGVPAKFNQVADAKRAIELPNEAEPNDFLDIFGRTRRDTPCVCETRIEPNLSQVLYLLFSPELQRDIANPEGAVAKLVKENKPAAEVVTELYLRTLSRPPSDAELADAVALIDNDPARQPAVEDLLWTLLNSKEFLFDH
ncbi:MAG TPA: S-layer protein, partial [Pirellulales bacterium]|nr:S-layer protein [Pirellulales bacterium]